jgi:hypothetical protein
MRLQGHARRGRGPARVRSKALPCQGAAPALRDSTSESVTCCLARRDTQQALAIPLRLPPYPGRPRATAGAGPEPLRTCQYLFCQLIWAPIGRYENGYEASTFAFDASML